MDDKKKKIQLDELKIESFITSFQSVNFLGGDEPQPQETFNVCIPTQNNGASCPPGCSINCLVGTPNYGGGENGSYANTLCNTCVYTCEYSCQCGGGGSQGCTGEQAICI